MIGCDLVAYKALDIARYVIDYSNYKKHRITNLRLQKILYFIQAAFLIFKQRPCFDDKIEAWGLGPVVPSVYQKYKGWANQNIPSAMDISKKEKFDKEYLKLISKTDLKMISSMIDECNKYTTGQLVNITHAQEPWKNTYKDQTKKVIGNDKIIEFFARRRGKDGKK